MGVGPNTGAPDEVDAERSLVRTVAAPVTAATDPVRGSRFVAVLAPAADEPTAHAVVATRRTEDPDATHHCWAALLADGTRRWDDDGEPRDTAGAPILRHLEGAGLVDVVAVVTRWYGGTKLGRGGLVRAYGDAVAAAIEAATVVERPRVTKLRFTHPYDLTGPVAAVLAAHEVSDVVTDHGADVRVVAAVPVAQREAFAAALAEATAGRVTATPVADQAPHSSPDGHRPE